MKAYTYHKYGPPEVFKFHEIEKPAPKENEVLLKVIATTVTPLDWHFRSGKPFLARLMAGGFRKPKINILGFDVCGEVEELGSKVSGFKKGDIVYGCIGQGYQGANAEYTVIPAKDLMLKPSVVSDIEAAAIPSAAITSLFYLKAGGLKSGQRILVNGASGGLGTIAVQIAKAYGAEVVGVCSTKNVELVKSLGADKVIDYTKEDFTKAKETFDIIFDAVGKSTFKDCKTILAKNGIYITTIPNLRIIGSMLKTSFMRKKAKFLIVKMPPENFKTIDDLIKKEKIKPVIDKVSSWHKLVEAHEYVENGHAKGRVVIKIE